MDTGEACGLRKHLHLDLDGALRYDSTLQEKLNTHAPYRLVHPAIIRPRTRALPHSWQSATSAPTPENAGRARDTWASLATADKCHWGPLPPCRNKGTKDRRCRTRRRIIHDR